MSLKHPPELDPHKAARLAALARKALPATAGSGLRADLSPLIKAEIDGVQYVIRAVRFSGEIDVMIERL